MKPKVNCAPQKSILPNEKYLTRYKTNNRKLTLSRHSMLMVQEMFLYHRLHVLVRTCNVTILLIQGVQYSI